MAKRKLKKGENKKKNINYRTELVGFLFILISVIGLGKNFGPVGKIVKSFAIFLSGSWYILLLAAFIALGIYMVIKAKWPNFWSQRMVGSYLIFLSLLVLSHKEFVVDNQDGLLKVFQLTIDNFFTTIDSIKIASTSEVTQGGGIIGAFFSVIFYAMFCDGDNLTGLYVIATSLMIFGAVGLTNISPINLVKYPYLFVKKMFVKDDIKEKEHKFEKDKRVIISNINEITQMNDDAHNNKEEAFSEKEHLFSSEGYQLPPLSLLDMPKNKNNDVNKVEIENNAKSVEKVLKDFDIIGQVVEVHVGPAVTQYEVQLDPGTKVSGVTGISKEMALALATKEIRIQPISGKGTIGVEIPNKETSMVCLKEILDRVPKSLNCSKLLAALGKDIMGNPIFVEINNTPHLLVAGATGSGKSVCINGIITSILMRARPDEVKILLIDPKKVEFTMYRDIPHLVSPVVTDPKEASKALRKVVLEMEQRYEVFSKSSTKNIAGYNAYIEKRNKTVPKDEQMAPMALWLIIVDELADLMMVASKEVEESITRITQLARAAGIHLIIATQRPSTDVITGLIKANIPSRISFGVSSSIDSRTILGMMGAEKLLGKGDMLFLPTGENSPARLQGNFVSEEEIERVVKFVKKQGSPKFLETFTSLENEETYTGNNLDDESDDPLYNNIVEFVIVTGKVSASLLQRKYHLGYNRAARIVDLLEERGIVGPVNGSKPREVLIKLQDKEEE